MIDKILIKRGIQLNLPPLSEGELAVTLDEKDVYVGTSVGNQLVGGASVVSQLGNASKLNGKPVPVPASTDDEKALVFDSETNAFKYIALPTPAVDTENAVSIQNIPVDITGLQDGYVLAYDAALNKFIAKPMV